MVVLIHLSSSDSLILLYYPLKFVCSAWRCWCCYSSGACTALQLTGRLEASTQPKLADWLARLLAAAAGQDCRLVGWRPQHSWRTQNRPATRHRTLQNLTELRADLSPIGVSLRLFAGILFQGIKDKASNWQIVAQIKLFSDLCDWILYRQNYTRPVYQASCNKLI